MIRLLIIGRSAADWGAKLSEHAPDMTVDMARLPAAGIRQLTATPPDAVLVVESSHADRVSTLVGAVRQQPLGALTPIVVLGEGLDPTLDVQAVLSGTPAPTLVLQALEDALELEQGELTSEAAAITTIETQRPPEFDREPTQVQPEKAAPQAARIETPKFILEEIVDEPPEGPREIERSDLFGARPRGRTESDVDEATVKRMLRSVRHEDYYAILGVHRGAETPAVRDAYYRQIERFDPQSVDVDLAHRHHLELSEIRDALEDAWAVLGDTDLRADYLQSTTRG